MCCTDRAGKIFEVKMSGFDCGGGDVNLHRMRWQRNTHTHTHTHTPATCEPSGGCTQSVGCANVISMYLPSVFYYRSCKTVLLGTAGSGCVGSPCIIFAVSCGIITTSR